MGQKSHYLAQNWIFGIHLVPWPTKKRCEQGGFSVRWVPKLLLSPVRIRIFCSKTTKSGPIWLVVVARGLYLKRHPFTLFNININFWFFLKLKIFIVENYLENGNKYAYLGSPGPVYSIADECGRGTEGKSSFIISLGNVGPLFHSIKLSFFVHYS